jgi:thiosulfate dehydrogenase (quinone) large subunit
MARLRPLATPLGVLAAILLGLIVNPWFDLPEDPVVAGLSISGLVTFGFWAAFILLLLALYANRHAADADVVEVEGPAFTRFLFSNSRAGLFWLPIRLFLGFAWLQSGWGKLTNPDWTENGEALRGFWERAVAVPDAPARPPITYEWYRDFIQLLLDNGAESWFAWVVMIGELAIGVALIIGLLTGIAAFFGAFMNMSFLLAGTASTNPVMFTLAIGLIVGWRVAGYYGLDRYVLPMLGTPWRAPVVARRPDEPMAV